jgi:hypothetical protein
VLQKLKHIRLDDAYFIFYLKVLSCLGHKSYTTRKLIDVGHIIATSGDELIGMIARATEEIEHRRSFKIYFIIEHIEKTFFGKVCSRSCRPVFGWWYKSAPTESTAYNPHKILIKWTK